MIRQQSVARRSRATKGWLACARGGMVTADNRDPAGGRRLRNWGEGLRIGHLWADEALRIVAHAPVQEDPALFCAADKLTFP